MQKTKLAIILSGILATSVCFADVPVVDGYDDSSQSSQQSNPDESSVPVVTTTPVAGQNTTAQSTATQTQSAPTVPTNPSLSLDQRVAVLERQTNNLPQLLAQMNSLQQQMQDLGGKLDIAKHDLQQLQTQMASQYQDLNQRLAKQAAPAATQTAAVDSDAADPASVAATTAAAASNTTPANKNAGDQKAYDAAFNLLKAKNYTQATTAFAKFVNKYPTSQYTANANYWLGQLYLFQNQPDNAIKQFQAILKKYPNNPKVPDAMMQLGLAYYSKGDMAKAKTQLTKVQQIYPGTNAAKLAAERLKKMNLSDSTAQASNDTSS